MQAVSSRQDLPPSYYDVTGINSCERLHPKNVALQDSPFSSEGCNRPAGSDSVTLDMDSIQVTFQYTNTVCEQSSDSELPPSYTSEIPLVLPGLPNLETGARRPSSDQVSMTSTTTIEKKPFLKSRPCYRIGLGALAFAVIFIVFFAFIYPTFRWLIIVLSYLLAHFLFSV